jgi:hypothetical protein
VSTFLLLPFSKLSAVGLKPYTNRDRRKNEAEKIAELQEFCPWEVFPRGATALFMPY